MDTAEMAKFHHEGARFVLTVIDVFSKKTWLLPLQDKSAASIVAVLEPLFQLAPPQSIFSDRGTEFLNRKVQSLFRKYKIRHWLSSSVHKASVAERVQKTLKQKLFKYFDSYPTNQRTFLQDLKLLVRSYNNTIHSTHGHTPNHVYKMKDVRHLWGKIYGKRKRETAKLSVGDYVRMVRDVNTFKKGFEPAWTREVFRVTKVMTDKEIPMFLVEDLLQKAIDSTFYAQELQKVTKPTAFLVEKYLKYRKRGGKRERLVQWQGYNDPAFNSWEEY